MIYLCSTHSQITVTSREKPVWREEPQPGYHMKPWIELDIRWQWWINLVGGGSVFTPGRCLIACVCSAERGFAALLGYFRRLPCHKAIWAGIPGNIIQEEGGFQAGSRETNVWLYLIPPWINMDWLFLRGSALCTGGGLLVYRPQQYNHFSKKLTKDTEFPIPLFCFLGKSVFFIYRLKHCGYFMSWLQSF